LLSVPGLCATVRAQQPRQPTPSLEDLLLSLSTAPADACEGEGNFEYVENQLFDQAEQAVAQSLNAVSNPGTTPQTPRERAVEALEKPARLSAKINAGWPEENRFQYEVVDVSPGLVMKMIIRSRATFSFFALTQIGPSDHQTFRWQDNSFDPRRSNNMGGSQSISVFPLHRGPAAKARFLIESGDFACGSGRAITYSAYEWDPESPEGHAEIIKLEDSVNEEDPIEEQIIGSSETRSLAPIGKVKTEGPLITLPYCWFSALDTRDNPSLCAVNTYDLSGDRVRFASGVVNRPDFLPIAKAFEYAQAHDYPAVRAYCASDDAARRLVENIPPSFFAEELAISDASTFREMVQPGEGHPYSFVVEKTADRWLVVSFEIE
jgi:hypothetical protein